MDELIKKLRNPVMGWPGNAETAEQAAAEIERLRAALAYYANEENYKTGVHCEDVLMDGGLIARRALGVDPEQKEPGESNA